MISIRILWRMRRLKAWIDLVHSFHKTMINRRCVGKKVTVASQVSQDQICKFGRYTRFTTNFFFLAGVDKFSLFILNFCILSRGRSLSSPLFFEIIRYPPLLSRVYGRHGCSWLSQANGSKKRSLSTSTSRLLPARSSYPLTPQRI
jgi:hypothetical protein